MASVPAKAMKNMPDKILRICHLSQNSAASRSFFSKRCFLIGSALRRRMGACSIVVLTDCPFNRREVRVSRQARPSAARRFRQINLFGEREICPQGDSSRAHSAL
jgi:hypothetical protein